MGIANAVSLLQERMGNGAETVSGGISPEGTGVDTKFPGQHEVLKLMEFPGQVFQLLLAMAKGQGIGVIFSISIGGTQISISQESSENNLFLTGRKGCFPKVMV